MSGLTGPARRVLVLLALAVVVLLAAAQWWQSGRGEPTVPAPTPTPTPTATASTRSGLPACTRLPAEVADAVAAVRAGGPYLRPRDDGGTFGNRERLLPGKPSGYYREYTVRAPGQRFPGPRRLITGGQARPRDEPREWFYTADHYESFCAFRPAR